MKTSGLILTLAALLLSSGCVTQQKCADDINRIRKIELERCRQDLDRVAAECANLSQQQAPIYDRGGFGSETK